MVEVDLRLFVTCRLCLDVPGHFQINPNVQQQIKYCFDIDVESFDGLPQLICKKCENILKEHYAIKKSFTEKQKELKTKLQCNTRKGDKSPSPRQNESVSCKKNEFNNKPLSKLDDSDSANIKDECHEKIPRKKKKVKKKRIVNRLMSSSDELELDDSSETQINVNAKTDSSYKNHIAWAANFNKYFVCRICSEGFQDKDGITKHIKKHSALVKNYDHIFKMSCLVVMEKSDLKPNICNSKKTVVYSSDSIIQNKHNPFYYIWYHPKTYCTIPDTFKPISEKSVSSSESTENDVFRRKRRRLLSRSSSETVVINRDSEDEDVFQSNMNPPTVIDCIDIDSSDNGSSESNEKGNNSTCKNKVDSKPMQNIIKMCHNKYTKKQDSLEKKYSENYKGKEDFLQHKVLSIGRKIINNKGFSCTGLLRFLEYKDLSVIWKETSVLNARNDSKYVRIGTRVRGNESNDTNNVEWKNFNLYLFGHDETLSFSNVLRKLRTYGNFKNKTSSKSVANEEGDMNSLKNLPRISSVFSHTDLEITKTETDNLLLKKLLNENPVSNPKQLPKKVNNNESYAKTMKVFSAPNTMPASAKQPEENETDVNTMPIVTSIVSLAPIVDKEKSIMIEESKNTLNNQQSYPRIKVKPVSELMPNHTVTSTISNDTYVNGAHNTTQIVIWPTQTAALNTPQRWPATQTSAVLVSNPQMWQNRNDSFIQPKTNEQYSTAPTDNVPQSSSKGSESPKEYIMLDTVELPNTKTTSPFQYLKDLLLVHNLILVGADQPLPTGSVSLIKLRLVYTQDKCLPITLCLSLFCLRNMFCIQVKDTNHSDVNVNNLSANWQWQLLKIYNNDVINKVLITAEKVGYETFKYTKEFFALLKSIKAKNEDL